MKLKLILCVAIVSTFSFGCSGGAENVNINSRTTPQNANAAPMPTSTIGANSNLQNTNGASSAVRNPKQTSAKDPAPQIGSGGDDLALFLKVRGSLSADPDLINAVIVDIKAGNASLTGKVGSPDKKKKAEELTRAVSGINSVTNNIKVGP